MFNDDARIVIRSSASGCGFSLRELSKTTLSQLQRFVDKGWLKTANHVSSDKKPTIIYCERSKMSHMRRYYNMFVKP